MALFEPKKICPIMSTATETRYCDSDCQLFVDYYSKEQNKVRKDCAILLIAAGGISRKDL